MMSDFTVNVKVLDLQEVKDLVASLKAEIELVKQREKMLLNFVNIGRSKSKILDYVYRNLKIRESKCQMTF